MAATGSEIASAYVTLIVRAPGVSREIDNALGGSAVSGVLSKRGKAIGATIAGAVGGGVAAMTTKAIDLVVGSIDKAVGRVDTMNNFPKIMKNLGYSAGDAQKSIDKISDSLTGLPTSLDQMAGTVQQLAPLTGGLDEATNLSLALNNALLAGGKSTDLQANAMEQYTQMLALGKVDMEAWRSVVTAMPGQMDQLAVSLLGAGNKSMDLYSAMQSGQVTFDDFNGAIVRLNSEGTGNFASFEQQARDSTDGISTGWTNLQTAITRAMANVIQRLKPMIDGFLSGATQIVNALGPVVLQTIEMAAAVVQWTSANRDWLIPLGIIVGTLVAFSKVVATIRAVKLGYAAASSGATAATYAASVASKIGAAAYALQNSSMVKLLASLRANEALSLRSKIAIVASTVATKAATVAQKALNFALGNNPIGRIIMLVSALVAGLVWFFTQTDTGKKIWGEFTRFLGEAWANISSFFQTVWENVLKPVFEGLGEVFSFVWNSILKPIFDGIAAVVTWVWVNVLQPIFQAFQVGFAILGGILQGVWEAVIKPVFDAIGAIFKWLWDTIISVIVAAVKLQLQIMGAVFTWLWQVAIKPAIDAIGAVVQWLWTNVISPVVDWISEKWRILGLATQLLWEMYIKPAFDAIGAALQWVWNNIISPVVDWIRQRWEILGLATRLMYEKYIKPAWNAVSSVIQTVWNTVKGVIDTMVRVVKTDPKKAFEAARDAIGSAWAGIQELAKKPVKFVVETVINGLIGTVNKILPEGMQIPTVKLPKGFSDGGYTGNIGRTTVAGVVHGNEHVIRAQSRAMIERNHPGLLDHMNQYGSIPGYRTGGLVTPLPQGSYSVSQPYHGGHNGIDLAAPAGTKVYAAADGVVGLAGLVNMGGNEIYIQHTNGLGTRYSHLSRFATSAGTQVKQGNVIGYVGSTGMSTGPHLHYMVHSPGGGGGNYGNHVNPAPYLGLFGKDLGEAGGAASILDGLVDWAVSKIKEQFPGGGMWVDVATGLAKNAASAMAKAFNPFAGADGHTATLYDNGGFLPTGFSLVENRSGRPEPILTGSQWDDLLASRGGGFSGPVTLVVGDREFDAYVDERADDAIDRANEELAVAGRRRY
ncbi:tape measure protein [Leucobacter allii]|uniref:Tape measure protein n=1 Tax=Leucobacter allii TaxID=2932247 RepID=A0ABY4FHU3_9MICO|nr:tape measure protein [Leucobacter allii]UOQ56068.1 tape measure protein [Leucobacter allii]